MGSLEKELNSLSQALLGEQLAEVDQLSRVLEVLREGGGPVTVTLWWDDEHKRRQSVVLQALEGEEILTFDPTRTLSQGESGMVKLPLHIVADWFDNRGAVALVPEETSRG